MKISEYMTKYELQDKIDAHIDTNVELMQTRMNRKNMYNSSTHTLHV